MQDIIAQLKILQTITPDPQRQQAQKAMLMQQVAGSARLAPSSAGGFVVYFREFAAHELRVLVQPAATMAVLALLVVSGGIFSITAASEATPGSFLYTVKLVGEKTQFALTPRTEDRVQLSVSFAQRRANELSTIAGAQNYRELEQVASSLVAQIMIVQSGLAQIESEQPASAVALARDIDSKTSVLREQLVATRALLASSADATSKTIDDAIAGVEATGLKALSTIVKSGDTGTAGSEDVSRRVANKIENAKEKISDAEENLQSVFSAGLGRSEQGVQVYNPLRLPALPRGRRSEASGASEKTRAASQSIAEAEAFLQADNYVEALAKISESEQLLREANDVVVQEEEEAVSSSTPTVKGVIEDAEEEEIQSEGVGTSTEVSL